MEIEFTAHNIRLDNGTFTRPGTGHSIEADPWFVSARRILDTVFPGDKLHLRVADLGCLEGGYAVEFARMGFNVLGLEVREVNMAACRYVQANTNLPNLDFVKDDAWNLPKYGSFDAVFCCGLFYHLDRPKQFLDMLSKVTRRVVIVQTHFATSDRNWKERLPRPLRTTVERLLGWPKTGNEKFGLSPITENDSLKGRWYMEFASDADFAKRAQVKWASWDNRRSFWVQREYLLQAMQDVGFDLVLEQYDSLGPNIAGSMLSGYYKTDSRGTFVGIKTGG